MLVIIACRDVSALKKDEWFIHMRRSRENRPAAEQEPVGIIAFSGKAETPATEEHPEEWLAIASRGLAMTANPYEFAVHVLREARSAFDSRAANRLPDESDRLWLLLDKSFPAALLEAIRKVHLRDDQNCLFRLPPPQPFVPDMKRASRYEPFAHHNPKKPTEREDYEFCLELLDEDERTDLKRALMSPRSVLITGGVGTGKSALARYIHYHTPETARGKFVPVNFAALPENLVESELYGIAAGTATDVKERPGLLREADCGTLFLDEIAEASQEMQGKLLHVVSEREGPISVKKVGDEQAADVAVRFIAATNRLGDELTRSLRRDLRSRFPCHMHLKYLDEKQPDPLLFYKRAVEHFTDLYFAYDPGLSPSWGQETISRAWTRRLLPRSTRELRVLVEGVFDRRRSAEQPLDTEVNAGELEAALEERGAAGTLRPGTSGPNAIDVESLRALLLNVEHGGAPSGLSGLSEDQAKDLVYDTKRLALNLAKWFGEGNRAKQRRVYGTRRADAFEKLLANPKKLHPDEPKRTSAG